MSDGTSEVEVERPASAICMAEFSVGDDAFAYFEAEAAKRKIPVARLMRRLVGIIAADKMVDAIMDDQK